MKRIARKEELPKTFENWRKRIEIDFYCCTPQAASKKQVIKNQLWCPKKLHFWLPPPSPPKGGQPSDLLHHSEEYDTEDASSAPQGLCSRGGSAPPDHHSGRPPCTEPIPNCPPMVSRPWRWLARTPRLFSWSCFWAQGCSENPSAHEGNKDKQLQFACNHRREICAATARRKQ